MRDDVARVLWRTNLSSFWGRERETARKSKNKNKMAQFFLAMSGIIRFGRWSLFENLSRSIFVNS
jgi:hypothetical protein